MMIAEPAPSAMPISPAIVERPRLHQELQQDVRRARRPPSAPISRVRSTTEQHDVMIPMPPPAAKLTDHQEQVVIVFVLSSPHIISLSA